MVPRYRSPDAFKVALEHRVLSEAEARHIDPNRIRMLRTFERLIARLAAHFGDRLVVKGALALDIRGRSRTTRDVDIRLSGDLRDLLQDMRSAAQTDLGDHFTFDVDIDADHPLITGPGIQYDGHRFRVQAKLAGKRYGGRFGVDVGVGDRMAKPPDLLETGAFFAFAGLPPVPVRVYAREVHLAEKLHAWTLPRERENSRVKDLPDIALLASLGPLSATDLRAAIQATFDYRGAHPVPDRLPDPPASWEHPYADMAAENALPWPTLAEALHAVRRFIDPVLAGEALARWSPDRWQWESPGPLHGPSAAPRSAAASASQSSSDSASAPASTFD